MRNIVIVSALFCLAPMASSAQVKVSGILECLSSSGTRATHIGDRRSHTYSVESLNCVWKSPLILEGIQAKEEERHLFLEATRNWSQQRGRSVGMMSNGDKYGIRWLENRTVSYWKSSAAKGKWMFTGGTGSIRGIEGGGSYERAAENQEGKLVFQVEGRYRLSKKKRPR